MHNVRIYKAVMNIPGLALTDRIVLSKLCQVSRKGESCYTNPQLASMTATPVESIKNAIKRLSDKKHIEIRTEKGGTVRYIKPRSYGYDPDDECDYYYDFTESELRDPRFTLTEKFILKTIHTLEKKPMKCFMGTYRFAAEIGVHYDTIKKAIRKLHNQGFINRTLDSTKRILRVDPSYIEKPKQKKSVKNQSKNTANNSAKTPPQSKGKTPPTQGQTTPHISVDTGLSFYKILSKDKIAPRAQRSFSCVRCYIKANGERVPLIKKSKDSTVVQKSKTADADQDSKPVSKQDSDIHSASNRKGLIQNVCGDVTPVKKTARVINIAAFQLYNVLLSMGATKHKVNTSSYKNALDSLHSMLTTTCENPYSNLEFKNIEMNSLKSKKFTFDEIVDIFQKYLDHCKIINKAPIKSISFWLFAKHGNQEPWSPFLSFYAGMIKRKKTTEVHFTPEAKSLKDEFIKIGVHSIDDRGYTVLSKLLQEKTADYDITQVSNHLSYFDIGQLFAKYVSEKLERKLAFKIGYVFGAIFINQFVEDMVRESILDKRSSFTMEQKQRAHMGYY